MKSLQKSRLRRIVLTGLAALAALPGLAYGADKYLQSLEDRIAALEAEVNATQTDAKGKGTTGSVKIPVYVVPKSKYVEEIKLRGRLQWQFGYSWGDGYQNPGRGSYSTQEIRRARIGVEGKLANDFRFLVEFEAAGQAGVGLVEAYIQYAGLEYFRPKVGKFKPKFGYEENISSAKILTVERSRITNAFATSQITGAGVDGGYSALFYSFGIFNAVPGGSASPNDVNPFASTNTQDYLYNASVGLNFTELVGTPLEFRADYMNFSTNPATNAAGIAGNQPNRLNLQNNINLSLNTGYGPFNLLTEWYFGFDSNAPSANLVKQGSGNEYVWAITVEPSVFIIVDRLQYVFRYEYGSAGFTTTGIAGTGNGGQPLASRVRYENRLPGAGAGALRYFALYNGLNWYINGDDLKLMFGHYYSEQAGAVGGGKANNRVAQTVYGAVRMQF